MAHATEQRGLTPNQLAKRYGVGIHKVLGWIKRGELRAINVAGDVGKRPQWSILPEDLATFESRRAPTPSPKSPPRQPKSRDYIEFFK